MAKKLGGVLEDHKRIGNPLKSPWLTEFNWKFMSYVDETLPEIILLGLLNDAHGYLYRSAKYVSMSFRAYDKATGISGGPQLPRDFFWDNIDEALGPMSAEDRLSVEDDLGTRAE